MFSHRIPSLALEKVKEWNIRAKRALNPNMEWIIF